MICVLTNKFALQFFEIKNKEVNTFRFTIPYFNNNFREQGYISGDISAISRRSQFYHMQSLF